MGISSGKKPNNISKKKFHKIIEKKKVHNVGGNTGTPEFIMKRSKKKSASSKKKFHKRPTNNVSGVISIISPTSKEYVLSVPKCGPNGEFDYA